MKMIFKIIFIYVFILSTFTVKSQVPEIPINVYGKISYTGSFSMNGTKQELTEKAKIGLYKLFNVNKMYIDIDISMGEVYILSYRNGIDVKRQGKDESLTFKTRIYITDSNIEYELTDFVIIGAGFYGFQFGSNGDYSYTLDGFNNEERKSGKVYGDMFIRIDNDIKDHIQSIKDYINN